MRSKLGWVVLAGAVLAGSAMAATVDGYEYDRRGDTNVFLKGGIGGYTGALSELTGAGPTWGLQLNLQPYRVIGIELGYEGSRNQISDVRVSGAPALTRHGGTALIKVAPPFVERVKPFVGLGVGASHVSVAGDTFGMYRNDIMEEVPLAAGLEFNKGSLTAGLRATYRVLLDEGFAAGAAPTNPTGGLLDASVTLGGRF